MRRRGRTHAALALAALLGAAACGAGEEDPPPVVRIDGSVGVMPLVVELAREYRRDSPGAALELGEGMGSGERLRALGAGEIDIALASHGLVPEELERQGMVAHEIARVAVVFGVHAGVPVTGLTAEQACAVFGGEIRSWSELDGPDLPIVPLLRPTDEVDDEVMAAGLPCWSGIDREAGAREIVDPSELARELAATPGAVGVTTLTLAEQSGGGIRPLDFEGVEPAAENVLRGGAYGLVRQFYLVTMDPPPAPVADFLEFVRSPAGARGILENGAVPSR